MLSTYRVVEVGTHLATAVCGRLFADLGASVRAPAPPPDDAVRCALALGKRPLGAAEHAAALREANVIITAGSPGAARADGTHPEQLRATNPCAVIVHVSPYGLHGPRAEQAACDLTLFAASGIAHLLIGQVDDPRGEPPQRPLGEQSAFVSGIAAACAAVNALPCTTGVTIDVSTHEALATLAITELTRAASGKPARPRKRTGDGNGATVCILPCRDGHVAISPREAHQWQAWLGVMGNPAFGDDPRFATKADRVDNWDALHAEMSRWSRRQSRDDVATQAQAAHVPSFALRAPHEHLDSRQLAERGFFVRLDHAGQRLEVPGTPFRITTSAGGTTAARAQPSKPISAGSLPLAGVRVLDFSWVIAGPTTTRYLAALGADVIKVEAPGRGDPGRSSELHTVLGQGKRAIVLDLKNTAGQALARALAAKCDLLIENFATGVMERFGLGAAALQAENPSLSYISASGLGREGSEAKAVAYGTLLQCYAGFAGLNGVPGRPPRVGMAWLDPMCGLLLALVSGAAITRARRDGRGSRVDFSMVEAMLWTMLEPLIDSQSGADLTPLGNTSKRHTPHDTYAAAGADEWVAIAVETDRQWHALQGVVTPLAELGHLDRAARRLQREHIDAVLSAWCAAREAQAIEAALSAAGVPAAAVVDAMALASCPHLHARGFWDSAPSGRTPGLPWQASFARRIGVAPGLGADTHSVMTEVLGLDAAQVKREEAAGAFGRAIAASER